ncbi:hypothetical protein AURDEDRAFT_124365 [Auricularia subglabra TFB-10046 SS5]|nr:hypothetical protein AURDEDRAFT_124365 [Auricularia subglabra TFB-10046 SS5]
MVTIVQREDGTSAAPDSRTSSPAAQAGGLPPPNHPLWDDVPIEAAPFMARSEWLIKFAPNPNPRPRPNADILRTRSPSPPPARTPPPSPVTPTTPPRTRILTPEATPTMSPSTSFSFSSPEREEDIAPPAVPWLSELQGVLDLPVADWREGEMTHFCTAGIKTHFEVDMPVDDHGMHIDPNDFLMPSFRLGQPLGLKALAEFSVLRSDHGLSLTYEEHAAIRAADAAVLYKSQAPNTRDLGDLHAFFLGQNALRALVFGWRTVDAISAATLLDRETDSITIVLSVRPEFEGDILDGDLLKPVIHLPESLLGKDGAPRRGYASALNDLIEIFRHRVAVPYARGFVNRLQRSGRIDYPLLPLPSLSAAASARLKQGRKASRVQHATPSPPPPPPCYACMATSTRPETANSAAGTSRACQPPASKRRIIPRLPGVLVVQGWDPAAKAAIVAALRDAQAMGDAAQDASDTMFAALRSLHVCGKHSVKILNAALDDMEHNLALAG